MSKDNKIWVGVTFKFKCSKARLKMIDADFLQHEIGHVLLGAANLQKVDTSDWSLLVEPGFTLEQLLAGENEEFYETTTTAN